jgi:hypothetical protein
VSISVGSSSLSGLVWQDADVDGDVDLGEPGIAGVSVRLRGTDSLGQIVDRTTVTDADGVYVFGNLRPGVYSLAETQPPEYIDGTDRIGTLGGVLGGDAAEAIVVGVNQDGFNYNFGERPIAANPVARGQLAEVGFWQNRNGQALILSLNGGPRARLLGSWLATLMPNYFGLVGYRLGGADNTAVAALFQQLFKLTGPKLDASVMTIALSMYVTNGNLAGTAGIRYGFVVSDLGVGESKWNIGNSGLAFGVPNGTDVRVADMLRATDAFTADGTLYAGDRTLRGLAHSAYAELLDAGKLP